MEKNETELRSIGLLKNIALGDETALEDFYHKYERRVYNYAFSRLNHSFDAADTLNEVMMEVWKYAERFEGRSKVSTWLLGITHHKVYDRLRKRKRSNLEDDIADFSNTLTDSNHVDMEKALEGVNDADMVRHCMSKLSDNHHEVIHLAFYQDMNYQDIASVAKCPQGTIKTRVFHAKQVLKDCIAKMMLAMETIV